MKAPKMESKFTLVPAGNHLARVYKIIEIGTVQEEYKGEIKEIPKITIGFELPGELHIFDEKKGPEPFVIARDYSFSMGEKANLRKLVEGILGVALLDEEAYAMDIEDLMGKVCLLNVVHKTAQASGNKYSMILGASPLPKGMAIPEQVVKPVLLTYEKWDKDLFNSLSKFTQDKLKDSKEYKKKFGSETVEGDIIDPNDIPF